MLLLYRTLAIIIGFILDLIIGDPRNIPHIIVAIGKLISFLEKWLRPRFPSDSKGQRSAGRMLVFLVLLFALLVSALIILIYYLCIPAGILMESLLVWQCLCMHDLRKESMIVYQKLSNHDLPGAQHAVSMIVGRDTDVLDATGVAKAAIETVAENTSDGIIAPMFYMLLLGGCGGLIYKAVNTMDSMVGYKNDRYIDFGRAAALTDDVFNYLPSRIAAHLMILAAALNGFNAKKAKQIYKRDCRKHDSPNSAQTESVCAGALEIQLAGDAQYFGKIHKKEFIGDPVRPVDIEDIRRANRLMIVTAVLMLVLLLIIRLLIYGGLHNAAF